MADDTTDADQADDTQSTNTGPDTGSSGDTTDWKAIAEQARADAEKWKSQSRKHEDRAKANADAASKAKTVEEQLADMQQRLADREAADEKAATERAVESLTARMVRAGMSDADAAEFAGDIDPKRLMADGKPDLKAIEAVANRLAKVAGRPSPDPDQGNKTGSAPADMSSLIRRASGRV